MRPLPLLRKTFKYAALRLRNWDPKTKRTLETMAKPNEDVYPFLCPKTNRLYLSPNEYKFTPKSANRRNLTIHDVQPNLHKLPKGFDPFYTDLTQLP